MDFKNCVTTLFITFLVFSVPVFSIGRLKSHTEKLNPEIYEIDYRGPETHSYMPPPNTSGGVNTDGGSRQIPKVHGRSKRLSTEKRTQKLRE